MKYKYDICEKKYEKNIIMYYIYKNELFKNIMKIYLKNKE